MLSAVHCSPISDSKVHIEVAGSRAYFITHMPNQLFALHHNQGHMHLVTLFWDQGDSCDLHLQAYSLDGVSESLKKAYKLFTDGKFSNALQAFNQMLWTIPLVVVSSRKEVDEVKELITICRCTPQHENNSQLVFAVCNHVVYWKPLLSTAESLCYADLHTDLM